MTADDRYPGAFGESLDGPARGAEAVTAHDSNELTYVSRAIYVGGGGNIAVRMANDSTVTFTAVPGGTVLPIRVKGINSTNTTATNMVSLY